MPINSESSSQTNVKKAFAIQQLRPSKLSQSESKRVEVSIMSTEIMSKEFLYSEVSEHSRKDDLYMVIEHKVYDVSKFLDEHPGGEEVILDVAGQDATEAFNDVGHSDEARNILSKMEVGKLAESEMELKPKAATIPQNINSTPTSSGLGIGLYITIFLGGIAAFATYKYLQSQEGKA